MYFFDNILCCFFVFLVVASFKYIFLYSTLFPLNLFVSFYSYYLCALPVLSLSLLFSLISFSVNSRNFGNVATVFSKPPTQPGYINSAEAQLLHMVAEYRAACGKFVQVEFLYDCAKGQACYRLRCFS